MRRAIGIDEGFIRRVYRTSALLYALISVYVYAYTGLPGWLGLTAGTGLSLLSLASVEHGVRRFLKRASAERPVEIDESSRFPPTYFWSAVIARYAIYALAVAAIAWAAQAGALNVFAFVGGFVLVHVVIVLKVIGGALVGQGNSQERLPSPRIGRGVGGEGGS
jgi:hypothetical protein